jgi:predicted amidophosphoribosyltransferase
MYCTYCGSKLHNVNLCPKTWSGSAKRANLRCSYCGSHEHDVKACPKTWGGNAARTWNEDKISDHFIKDWWLR